MRLPVVDPRQNIFDNLSSHSTTFICSTSSMGLKWRDISNGQIIGTCCWSLSLCNAGLDLLMTGSDAYFVLYPSPK